MSLAKDIGLSILAVLFPPACINCGRVEGRRSQDLCLCRPCRARLRQVERSACILCGGPTLAIARSPRFRCLRCTDKGETVRQQLTLWRYEAPIDAVIHGLKFKRMEFLGSQLAAALHLIHSEALSEIDMVVPIPLYWCRRLVRGYNQAEAIAQPLSERLGAPLVRALWRRRPTRAQARLDRDRRLKNLRSAVVLSGRDRRQLTDRHLLLVDDVVTTGATMSAAVECFKPIGVESITTIAVAATPEEGRRTRSQMLATVEDGGFTGF